MKGLVLGLTLLAGPACLAQNGDVPAVRRPARISGGVMAGQLLNHIGPRYPQEAKDAGVSGTVVMHAVIGKDGTIESLTVISGPELLRDASVSAVQQWTYKPYLLNGVPTEVDTTITVNFTLGGSAPPPPDSN